MAKNSTPKDVLLSEYTNLEDHPESTNATRPNFTINEQSPINTGPITCPEESEDNDHGILATGFC